MFVVCRSRKNIFTQILHKFYTKNFSTYCMLCLCSLQFKLVKVLIACEPKWYTNTKAVKSKLDEFKFCACIIFRMRTLSVFIEFDFCEFWVNAIVVKFIYIWLLCWKTVLRNNCLFLSFSRWDFSTSICQTKRQMSGDALQCWPGISSVWWALCMLFRLLAKNNNLLNVSPSLPLFAQILHP